MTDSIQLNFSPANYSFENNQQVHVWFLDLSQLDHAKVCRLGSIISPSEFERAQQFKFKYLQERELATRIFVRLCLSRYVKLNPKTLKFSNGANGKPYLLNAPQPLHFNLSHSGELLVLAISTHGEVGIDIETKRHHDFLEIGERFFHANEFKRMRALDHAEGERSFYRLWTLKEAFFKALGIGITAGLHKIQIDLDSEPLQFTVADELHVRESEWQLVEMHWHESIFLALAQNHRCTAPDWFDGRIFFEAASE